MSESSGNNVKDATQKYLALISIIEQIQHRLQCSELVYILLNLLVFFPSIFLVQNVLSKPDFTSQHFAILQILFAYVIGMLINAYWTITSIRLQLKLKLRYFQARILERKNNDSGEHFISDEGRYFNPEIGIVESFDGKETIVYPKKGMLRMDGFIGAAKPRYLSLLIPLIFFVMYLVSFFSVLDFIVLTK